MAEFEETFDVEKSTKEDYKLFIEKLRAMLRDHSLSSGLGYLPVLPPQPPTGERPTRFFDIIFRASDREVRVRFRRDNVFLVGYQSASDGRWYEFGNPRENPPQLIPNSTFLGYSGTYVRSLLKNLLFGKQQLINAVYQLSTDTEVKRNIFTLCQMISEAIRFRYISDHLVKTYYRGGLPPTERMLALEHMWGNLSDAVRVADPDPDTFRFPTNNVFGIENASQAVALLGIVLQCAKRKNLAGDEVCTGGRPLAEVYSVRILNIDDENPGDLYGTITVSDGINTQYIFNRSRDNIQSIRPREFAILTGPERAISALDDFTIVLHLIDRDEDFSADDEVSKGEIPWGVSNTANVYDDPIYHNVPGKHGSAEVNYIVFSDAVQATVEVTLVNGDDENPANIYGTISCWNDKFTNQSVLFQRTSDDDVDVRPGNLIPLWRSVVAVPLSTSVIVRADVWDYDVVGTNDEIAVGTVDFPAQLSGTSEKPVYGKNGEISVKVTWN